MNKKKKIKFYIYRKKLHHISVLKHSANHRVIQLSNYYMSNLDIYNRYLRIKNEKKNSSSILYNFIKLLINISIALHNRKKCLLNSYVSVSLFDESCTSFVLNRVFINY